MALTKYVNQPPPYSGSLQVYTVEELRKIEASIDSVNAFITDLQTPPVWSPLPFQTGWTDLPDGNWSPVEYSKDEMNRVHIRGLARWVPTSPDIIAILPEGFRPLRNILKECLFHDSVGYFLGRIDINFATGQVIFIDTNAGQRPGNWINMNYISYFAER